MNPLNVLLVDDRVERRAAVLDQLESAHCRVVAAIGPEDDLLRTVRRHTPDVVIIDIDSPSRDTLESLRCVQSSLPHPMVMFSQDDQGQTIRSAVEAGVCAYIVDGISAKRVRPILEAAMARFARYRDLESELQRARSQLADRKLIERAKGILMSQRGVDEQAAYQLMRKAAMDRNRKVADIADGIIATAEMLGGKL